MEFGKAFYAGDINRLEMRWTKLIAILVFFFSLLGHEHLDLIMQDTFFIILQTDSVERVHFAKFARH